MKNKSLMEVKSFDFRGLARMIMRADGVQYVIVIDDDRSIYWDFNVDSVKRGNKNLIIIPCPSYPEPLLGKREERALAAELRRQVIDTIKNIPDNYWV